MINRGQSFKVHDAAWQMISKGYELFGKSPELWSMFCNVVHTLTKDPKEMAYNIIAEKTGFAKEVAELEAKTKEEN